MFTRGRIRGLSAPTKPTLAALVRCLHVQEHVSLELLRKYGLPTPDFAVARTPQEAESVFRNGINKGMSFSKVDLRASHTTFTAGEPTKDVVVKAQVLTGSRSLGTFKSGFAGGVHKATTADEAQTLATEMLGNELVTQQAPEGIPCHKVLLMERMNLRKEMYVSIVMDRITQGPMVLVSPRGGSSIEDIAESNPEIIFMEPIDIMDGLTPETCHRMAHHLGLTGEGHQEAMQLLENMYQMFQDADCTLVEINPLAETAEGRLVVCDAKVNFDDNAAFRQAYIFDQRDTTQEDEHEVEARQYDINYVGLHGDIGCMVNGAGLAMSTMDLIEHKGGSAANFLDVDGGNDEYQIQKGIEILNDDPMVKAILVNIFGGILRCDVIAKGIIDAANHIGISKPVVVRLQGTNMEEAKFLIESSGYSIILAEDLEDAAEKVVEVAKIAFREEEKICV